MNINENYMTWDEVCRVVNRTKPTVWRWVQKGAFPGPKYRKADGLLIGFARNEIEHYCRTGEVL
jgi:excisionase family DNA binding protein